ncbi:LON peptidase substrate-binding domain-containing protein [Nocardioides marmoraquaticus]
MPTVPLFPLNAVVFPGVATPLHVFEDRYRAMVRELLAVEQVFDRVFGVVAIREGYEVGDHGTQSVHRVGTLVQLTEVTPYEDGRFDIEVLGRERLRVLDHDGSGPFLRGEVAVLPDRDEPDAQGEADHALEVFEAYRLLLSELRGGPVLVGDLPRDPAYLSYALASTCLLTLPQRQSLLECDSAARRLEELRRTLVAEMRAMRAVPSLPATQVARTRWSPN